MSKFTGDRFDVIVDALGQGATYTSAASAAGVTYETLRRWMRLGEADPDGRFGDLVSRIADARARCPRPVSRASGLGRWTTVARVLERCFPNEFGRRRRASVTSSDTSSTDLDALALELYQRIVGGEAGSGVARM